MTVTEESGGGYHPTHYRIASGVAWAEFQRRDMSCQGIGYLGPGDVGLEEVASVDGGFVVLHDNVPRASREPMWRRLMTRVQELGFQIAAKASWPLDGPDDGHTEVVLLHATSEDREVIGQAWCEAAVPSEEDES